MHHCKHISIDLPQAWLLVALYGYNQENALLGSAVYRIMPGSRLLYVVSFDASLHKRWGCLVRSCTSCFTPGEINFGNTGQGAGWAMEPVWTFWKMENILPLSGMKLRFLGGPAYSLVAIGVVFTLFCWNQDTLRNPSRVLQVSFVCNEMGK